MAVREFTVAFAMFTIGYLLFAGQLSGAEIGLAIVVGMFAALWTVVLGRVADIRFRFEWQACAAFAAAIAGVPRAAARVAWVLFSAGRQRPRGSIVEQPFLHGRDHSAADATRRAAVLLAISLAPDRFVLLHERDRLWVHRLDAAPQGGDARWPA